MSNPGSLNAAQKVEHAGRALYGDNWQTPLALDLGVNLRTVQRVSAAAAAGEDYAAARAWKDDLLRTIDERLSLLIEVRNEIARN